MSLSLHPKENWEKVVKVHALFYPVWAGFLISFLETKLAKEQWERESKGLSSKILGVFFYFSGKVGDRDGSPEV